MLQKADFYFVWANKIVIGLLMLVMTILVFANVVMRYFVGISLPWVEESTRYMMIWVAYLGAGLALRAGAHVAVEVVQDMLPPTVVVRVRLILGAMILLFLLSVAWYGLAYAQFAMPQTSPVLGIPLGIIYLGVPIGCLLAAIHLLFGFRPYVDRIPHLPGADEQPVNEPTAERLGV
ncbi:TRAP-type C4-dicarboxylate transport system permease small subunit [Pseudorhizobium tarimense]|uniref:TRAP transporter small permease protein n=1 Tax=Pseudorhizobium tarimense TaxID=1079109 RepID=A0ABV2HBH3_9HYPH|nr:TRAP transporter small permease [Pseudorhizobium tarimense]MCJ8520936.1 TRAP transporter small permease [Pseudorhizobium tarimense]